jgi:hypothetical protein
MRWVLIGVKPTPLDLDEQEPAAGRVLWKAGERFAFAITLENLERARRAVATGWHVSTRHHITCPKAARHAVPRAQGELFG